MQPPGGEPGSDPADPQATPSPPGPDTDTTRLPWEQPPVTPPTPARDIRAARRGAGSARLDRSLGPVGVADRAGEPGGPGSARPVVCRHGLALRGLRPRQHHRVDHRLDHRRGPWARAWDRRQLRQHVVSQLRGHRRCVPGAVRRRRVRLLRLFLVGSGAGRPPASSCSSCRSAMPSMGWP